MRFLEPPVHGSRATEATNGLRERPPVAFAVAGATLAVRVRESSRARTARIVLGPGRPLEIIVPRRVSRRDVGLLLEGRRGWIERRLAEAREASERAPRLGLERAGSVWLRGHPVPVERTNGNGSVARLRGGRLIVAGPEAGARDAIERWYRRQALTEIAERVAYDARRLGVGYGSIACRDQRTRWGSCSASGTLSFSWRLVLAPPEALAYVVVHELCHLREPNHSKAFWRLVEAARPSWREEAAWLREYGHELRSYDPAVALQPPRAGAGSRTALA